MFKLIFFLLLLFPLILFGQEKVVHSEKTSDCKNAFNISGSGEIEFTLTGDAGKVNDLLLYTELNAGIEQNSAWFIYTPTENGRLSLNLKSLNSPVQLVLFQNVTSDYCRDLQNKIATIERKILDPTKNEIGLSLNVNQNVTYPLEVKENELVLILIQSKQAIKQKIFFDFDFESFNFDPDTITPLKIVDYSKRLDNSKLILKIRDKQTGKAIIGSLTLTESKTINGLYVGSDFVFSIDKAVKLRIKCDAPGYFFSERIEAIPTDVQYEIIIYLTPLGFGKSLKMDGIEFIPGQSEFMPTAEKKLRQLYEFLKMNPGINIEIQGHVNTDIGEKSLIGTRLSEARAKKVYTYLIENGINKTRMTYKGFGGTMPIYPKPITLDEEQSNRRVEVKIF